MPLKSTTEKKLSIDIKPLFGFDLSKTSFNFAGNEQGNNPNILSELIWSNTLSPIYGGSMSLSYRKFNISSTLIASNNISGDVSDKDYNEDNRQDMFNESYSSNHKGIGLIYNIKPGYYLIKDYYHSLIAFMGYEYTQRQNFLLNKDSSSRRNNSFQKGLNSNYDYRFHNFGAGASYTYTAENNIYGSIKFETYFSNYYAQAEWNLRTDLNQPISFTHKGKGIRMRPEVEIGFSPIKKLKIGVNYAFDYYNMNNGIDNLNTTRQGVLKHKLNNVNIMIHRIYAGLTYTIL